MDIKKARLNCRSKFLQKLVYYVVPVLLVAHGCAAPGKNATKVGNEMDNPAQTKLITSINTKQLLAAIDYHVGAMPAGTFGGYGVIYPLKSPKLTGINLGVHVSEQQARDSLKSILMAYSGKSLRPKDIGDEFEYILSTNNRNGDEGGLLRLRRSNVTVTAGWKGDAEGALAFARKMDQMILNLDEIFPKGKTVSTPEIEWTVPEKVLQGSQAQIQYKTKDDTEVLISNTLSSTDTWRAEGTLSFSTRELGKQQTEFTFATRDNIIFKKSVEVNVVSKTEFAATQEKQPWQWLSGLLYFKESPDQDFGKLRSREKEWINLQPGTLETLTDPARVSQVREQAMDDLKRVVQGRWLPQPEFIETFYDHWQRVSHEVYYATFQVQDYRLLYLGVPGRHAWLYLEHDAKKQKPLEMKDIVLPKLLQSTAPKIESGPEFLFRRFTRYRAFESSGIWEPVEILMLHFRFPQNFDFSTFGYAFPQSVTTNPKAE